MPPSASNFTLAHVLFIPIKQIHILQACENDCFHIYVSYTKMISEQLLSSNMSIGGISLSN